MRIAVMVVAAFILAAVPVYAQDHPRSEVFGGYSYMKFDGSNRPNLHGWALSIAGNAGPRGGLVAEFSGHYGDTRIGFFNRNSNVHTFLTGPRITSRGERGAIFGHILLGGARRNIDGFSPVTKFAMATGAGGDVNINRNMAIRVVQVDYLPVRFNGGWAHNARVQTGVVFKLGRR